MKQLIILTDNKSDFQLSKPDLKFIRSMEIEPIKKFFEQNDFNVKIIAFYDLDLTRDYKDFYVLYQTSELPGLFYKHYIEDIIFFLEGQGAIVLPKYEYLKAHHNKVFMELLRARFNDESLKTIKSMCFGSWEDGQYWQPEKFPVVVKKASGCGGKDVFLAGNYYEYRKSIKKAGKVLISDSVIDLPLDYLKKIKRNFIKYLYPTRSKYLIYDTTPVSTSIIVQNFIEGMDGDCRVLIAGKKFYAMYRKNRANDFRASGSGKFSDVPESELKDLFNFARRVTFEIDFPLISIDIGYDGFGYHLIEFQMLHFGTSALQRSKFWYEFHDDNWVRFDGASNLEEEYSRAIYDYIENLP